MAARGSRASSRAEAERARLYAARAAWNAKTIRRRRRDTIVAVVAGSLIVAGALVSQVVHAQVTAPEPGATPTPAPTQTPGE